MTKEQLPPEPPPAKKGDKTTGIRRGPYEFEWNRTYFRAARGEWVVVTFTLWPSNGGWLNSYPSDMRPATRDEVEEHLGPVRWWQWRRRLEARSWRLSLPRATAIGNLP